MIAKNTIRKDTRTFQVIKNGIVLKFQAEPEGGYTITVPSLPGCLTYAENFEQAFEMIRDAIEGWLAVARTEGVPIPEQFKGTKMVAL